MNLSTIYALKEEMNALLTVYAGLIIYTSFPITGEINGIVAVIAAYALFMYWQYAHIPNTYPIWVAIRPFATHVFITPEVAREYYQGIYDQRAQILEDTWNQKIIAIGETNISLTKHYMHIKE
jgi:hypothetical protein